MQWKWLLAAGIIALGGCVGAPPADRSFTREWAEQIRHESDFKARQKRLKEKEDPAASRSETHPETRGQYKPHESGGFPVGGDTGLGGTVDTDGAGINYKIKW